MCHQYTAFTYVINTLFIDQDLNPISTRPFTVPGLAFFHDFVVTKNYYIFNAAPLKFDPIPFALGQKAPAQVTILMM